MDKHFSFLPFDSCEKKTIACWLNRARALSNRMVFIELLWRSWLIQRRSHLWLGLLCTRQRRPHTKWHMHLEWISCDRHAYFTLKPWFTSSMVFHCVRLNCSHAIWLCNSMYMRHKFSILQSIHLLLSVPFFSVFLLVFVAVPCRVAYIILSKMQPTVLQSTC